METETQVISTEQELIDYADLMFTDIGKALDQHKTIDKSLVKPIKFRIPTTENENPFITYSWMKVFIEIQTSIYTMMEGILGRNLTDEEEKKLELKIYISSGSNIYEILLESVINFLVSYGVQKIIEEAGHDMNNLSTVLAYVVPITLGFIAMHLIDKSSDNKKALLEQQKIETENKQKENEKARIENEKEKSKQSFDLEKIKAELQEKDIEDERASNLEKAKLNLEQKKLDLEKAKLDFEKEKLSIERNNKALDSMAYILECKDKTTKKVARKIKAMPDVDTIELNGETITHEEIVELAKRKHRERKDEKNVPVDGNFKCTFLEKNRDKTHMSIEGEGKSKGINFTNFNFDPAVFDKEIYSSFILGESLHWKGSVQIKGDKVLSFAFSKIEEPIIEEDNIE